MRFLQEMSDGTNARFGGWNELGQVRASGMQLQGCGRQAILFGFLRAAGHERIAVAGRLRLRPSRVQEGLNHTHAMGATPRQRAASFAPLVSFTHR